MSLLCVLFIATWTAANALNLTYGRWRFTDNIQDRAISFASMKEYKLFLQTNGIDSTEPGYLVKLIAANQNKHAACLDGSPQAFYFRPGSGDGVNKFNIYLQGGGWCQGIDEATCSACDESCVHRAQYSDRGTSAIDEPYLYFPFGYLSNEQTDNPLTYNWNTVYVRYCDGSSFSGNNDTATYSQTQPDYQIYFRGFNNLNAVFNELVSEYDLGNATHVLLTGSSAGGLAVYLHADYIRDTFVSREVQQYLAMPDSGFFLDYQGNGEYDSCMQWVYQWQNTSIALNRECVQKFSEQDLDWKCMFAQNVAPFIASDMFALQSRFDLYQINSELREKNNDSAVNIYGANLTQVFVDSFMQSGADQAKHYAFLDSCYHHTNDWNLIVIDNYTSSMAQVDIYFGNDTEHSRLWFQNQTYPCSSCC